MTEQNKNAMALGGLHEVSWWCQSSPQWTLFIRKEKQTPPHSTNWHPCCHCQQLGQGYNSHRKKVFRGHCWGTMGRQQGQQELQGQGQLSSPELHQGLHQTRSAWKGPCPSVTPPRQMSACQKPLQEQILNLHRALKSYQSGTFFN